MDGRAKRLPTCTVTGSLASSPLLMRSMHPLLSSTAILSPSAKLQRCMLMKIRVCSLLAPCEFVQDCQSPCAVRAARMHGGGTLPPGAPPHAHGAIRQS